MFVHRLVASAILLSVSACGVPATTAAAAPPPVASPPCDRCVAEGDDVRYRKGEPVDAVSKTDGHWHRGVVMDSTPRAVIVLFPEFGRPEAVRRKDVRKRARP